MKLIDVELKNVFNCAIYFHKTNLEYGKLCGGATSNKLALHAPLLVR